MSQTPSLYLDSKLFHRPSRDDRDTTNIGTKKAVVIPDPQKEDLEPEEDDISATKKAIGILKATVDTTGKLEGKFKVSVEEMIRHLNRIISAEYSQWMRYYHYSLVLRGHCRDALAEEFEEHAREELEHAGVVAMRVVGLGGYPTTDMEHPSPLRDTEEILKELLLREQEGMQLYREVLALCGDNEGTRQILEGNVGVEQDHIDELWRFLKNPESIGKSLAKAGADQESAGVGAISEGQSQRRHRHSFHRTSPGISGGQTPDLPERGRDWHGTVPGVKDEPQDSDDDDLDRPPVNLVDDKPDAGPATTLKEKNEEAAKALAGAPRFSPGPLVSPPEKEFLKMHGWSEEDIQSGRQMPSRLRAEFNKWLTAAVQKSMGRLSQ